MYLRSRQWGRMKVYSNVCDYSVLKLLKILCSHAWLFPIVFCGNYMTHFTGTSVLFACRACRELRSSHNPSGGWQPFSPTHCIKWQGHGTYCGTIRDKISPHTSALPSTTTSVTFPYTRSGRWWDLEQEEIGSPQCCSGGRRARD